MTARWVERLYTLTVTRVRFVGISDWFRPLRPSSLRSPRPSHQSLVPPHLPYLPYLSHLPYPSFLSPSL